MKKKLICIVLAILTLFSFVFCVSCSTADKGPIEHTVSFNSNGGSAVLEVNVADGEKCVKPAEPQKDATETTCYEFEYWYEVDEKIPFDFNSSITKDLTLNAKWTERIRTYSIVFKNYDGTILQVISVEYNQMPEYTELTPEKEAEPNKKFVFSGWDKEVVKVSKEETYVAQFIEKELFCITFELEDGTQVGLKQLYVGELFDFLTVSIEAPDGKDFYGWVVKGMTDVILTNGIWDIEENVTVIPLFKDEVYSPIY